MRIALCFSGQPRFIADAYPTINREIIQNRNVDVFAHLWFDEKLQSDPYKYGGNGEWVNQRIASNSIDQFIDLYNPVSIKVEPSRKFINQKLLDEYFPSIERYKKGSINNPLEPDFTKRDINNIISYYYSLNQVNILKKEYEYEKNFKYDVVIKLRTDVIVNSRIDFSNIASNTIYYSEMGQPDGMVSDWLDYGDSKSMDVFMSPFSNLELLIEDSINRTGGAWCCEMIHRMAMDRFGISPSPQYINLALPRF
jgi:hypothetical protein